jgi:hypothetical protein
MLKQLDPPSISDLSPAFRGRVDEFYQRLVTELTSCELYSCVLTHQGTSAKRLASTYSPLGTEPSRLLTPWISRPGDDVRRVLSR